MNRRTWLVLLVCFGLVAVGLLAATSLGVKMIPVEIVWKSIFRYDGELDAMLVRDSRLPRAVCSALVGGMLAMTGAIMQGITRNPMAEPSLLGMTQGATLAVAIASVNMSVYGLLGNSLAALLGAVASGALVLLFSMQNVGRGGLSRLLMAGTAMSTFFLSLASMIALLGNRSRDLAFWLSGGFRTATWKSAWLLLAVACAGILLSLALSGRINILSLGDEAAAGLGVKPGRVRIQAVAVLIPLCAVCVATAGNIAFVGLIVPHILRRLLGDDARRLIPMSFAGGAALLVWADIAAKMANPPYELPIGLFSALMGIPIFIAQVRRERT